MTDSEFNKLTDDITETKGHKKFLLYIDQVIKREFFQDFIHKARFKYKVPINGFKDEDYTLPPKDWVYKNDRRKSNQLDKEIGKISRKYELHHLDGLFIIQNYLFYNSKELYFEANAFNLLLVSDLMEEKKEPFSRQTQNDDDLLYPIAIRISPYASKRDILDFVSKTYKHLIKPMQDGYKNKNIKLGALRKKKTTNEERDEFIYQNRHLPRKKICSFLIDNFEIYLDEGHVGKIISLEKKRRKEL